MSSYVIDLPSPPVNVACSATDDSLAVLFADGRVQVWDLNTKIPDPKSGSRLRGGGKVADPQLRWEAAVKPEGQFVSKQVAFGAGEVAALSWTDNEERGAVVTARDGQSGQPRAVGPGVDRLIWADEAGWLVHEDGVLTSSETTWYSMPEYR